MAESKKTSAQKEQERLEFAETLRRAAEILEGAANQPTEAPPETPAKKPAAKKPAAKKEGTKATKSGTSKSATTKSGTTKSGTSKAPAKKPTTKKPATKAAPKAESVEVPAETEPQKKFGNRRSDCKNCGAENDKDAVVCHVCGAQLPPLPNGQLPVQPKPVVEEKPVEQKAEEPSPASEPAPEQKAEEPVSEQKAEEPKQEESPKTEEAQQPVSTEPPAAEQPAQSSNGKKSGAFMDKTSGFINNKGKLPLWIVANALLLLTSVFLIIGAFSLSYNISGIKGKITCSVFQYFGNVDTIKSVWHGTAGAWANGGFVMIGILMFFSFLVPLALIAKNVVLFVLKKNKNVHMLDAIISFAFLIAYLGVVNLYGANMTWAHILAIIMAIVLLAYTIFAILIENREGQFPFYSIANILLIMLCTFLLTSNKIYAANGWYAAAAAGASGAGGFAFIMLLFTIAALVLMLVMQVKKLPGKLEYFFDFIVPAAAGVFALIALISFVGGKPDGLSVGGGFVFGVILTILFAVADVVFVLVPKLKKFVAKVSDRMPAKASKPVTQPVVEQPVQQQATEQPAATQEQPAATQEQPAQPQEQPAPAPAAEPASQAGGKVYCPACGTENSEGSLYCLRCGRKLN